MEENRLPYETLKIGDTEYKLKISASSAIEIEKKTGKSLVAGMTDFDKLETVTLYLWGALNRFQANIDIRKAQEIYDDYIDAGGDLSDMAEILFKTLTVSGFFKRQQAEKLLALAEKAEWSSAGELITNLYRPALTAGITHKDFWDLSVREITQAIQAKNEYDKAHTELNERLMCAFAYSIGQLVAIGVNAPKLYGRDKSEGIPVSDWELSKQNMAEYAAATKGRYSK